MKFISSWLRSSDSFVSSCRKNKEDSTYLEERKLQTKGRKKTLLYDEVRAGCSATSREACRVQ